MHFAFVVYVCTNQKVMGNKFRLIVFIVFAGLTIAGALSMTEHRDKHAKEQADTKKTKRFSYNTLTHFGYITFQQSVLPSGNTFGHSGKL